MDMDRLKLAILTHGYPSKYEPYNYTFVHARVRKYIGEGHKVRIFWSTKERVGIEYSYENVNVFVHYNPNKIIEKIKEFGPDALLAHAPTTLEFKIMEKLYEIPKIHWIHGFEVIPFYKDVFPVSFFESPRDFILHLIFYGSANAHQINTYRKYIRYNKDYFVFVSNWMKRMAEYGLKQHFDREQYEIIPNPVDPEIFPFNKKFEDQRFDIVTLRWLNGRKYAVDIALKSLKYLDSRFSYTLYGVGKYSSNIKNLVKKISNQAKCKITFIEKLFHQSELKNVYKNYGIALYPTRMDAQGVSMCEASASGLPVITSNVTAVPEFFKNGVNGFLCNSPKEIAEAITYLGDNPKEFLRMSKEGSKYTLKICGIDKVISRELKFISNVVNSYKI